MGTNLFGSPCTCTFEAAESVNTMAHVVTIRVEALRMQRLALLLQLLA
jgi:hypothetical protein